LQTGLDVTMPMNKTETEARVVIETMRSFKAQIERILVALEGKRSVTPQEKEELQRLLKSLKNGLKESAKYGTVSGKKQTRNHFEQAYFMPAVFAAAAHFNIAVNSHPIKSNWYSCLYGVEMDINHLLYQLENQFPDS
jgi:hypothetical protein